MKATFTAGPWRLSRTQRYVMDGVAAPWVCEVTERPGWEANARLIASAPALLEALKEAVEDLVDFARSRGSEYEGTEDDLVGRYRTAISQAEGGE